MSGAKAIDVFSWNERNNLIFRNIKPHPAEVSMQAALVGKESVQANQKSKRSDLNKRSTIIKWIPPKPNFLKINFDESVIKCILVVLRA